MESKKIIELLESNRYKNKALIYIEQEYLLDLNANKINEFLSNLHTFIPDISKTFSINEALKQSVQQALCYFIVECFESEGDDDAGMTASKVFTGDFDSAGILIYQTFDEDVVDKVLTNILNKIKKKYSYPILNELCKIEVY